MAVYFGRLEAYVTSPAGTYELIDSGGTYTEVLAEGALGSNVSFTSFVSNFQSWAEGNGGSSWTMSLDGGEGGTGKVTIDCNTTPWSLTMPSETRELLGFTGNISAVAVAQTGTNHVIGAWLPVTPLITERGYNDAGTYITDMRQTISPRGDVYTVWGNAMTENSLTWRHTPLAKTLISAETTTNESFERFYRKCILGEHSAFTPGPKLALYWNADAGTPITVYRSVGMTEFRPSIVQPGWTGLWDIIIPRVLKVPS